MRRSRNGFTWALVGIVCQHLSMARIAEALTLQWNAANDAVLAEGQRVLIDDPHRLNDVPLVDADDHFDSVEQQHCSNHPAPRNHDSP